MAHAWAKTAKYIGSAARSTNRLFQQLVSGFSDWHFVPGLVEGRPAVLVHDPADPSATPRYIILVDWAEGRISAIRDFRYARYVLDGAELSPGRQR